MREYRKTHPVFLEQRWKANARSYANVAKRRNILVQRACQDCGSFDSQMHHPDYSQPLLVQWLCRPCHMALHNGATVAKVELAVAA